jgi:hypothetical protein
MSIHQVTKEYVIDLQESEENRWSEVIRKECKTAKALIGHATRDFLGYDATRENSGGWTTKAIRMFSTAYRFSGGHYRGELEAWASAVGCTAGELTLLNCQYELSHLAERSGTLVQGAPVWLRKLLRLGCTAGAVRLGTKRVVHVRNMDWPLKPMGKATRIFRFVDGDREFVTVGVPGMVGALSGMVPGAYSVTIDYAPPTFMPGFDFGPLFLLRHVFETCDTYEEACNALSHTKLSANVLFMICSAKGQACIIERTRNAFAKVPMRGGTLTVANHYRSKKFSKENDGWHPDIIENSKDRADVLNDSLKNFGPRTPLEQVACALDAEPVLNDETRQMMAFDPSSGEVLVWANH